MKRRSFLQSIGAGIAALFVPKVAAEKLTTETIGDLVWTTTDSGRVINVAPVGSTCIWLSPTGVVEYDGRNYKTLSEAVAAI